MFTGLFQSDAQTLPHTTIFVLNAYFGGEFDDLLTELTSMVDETQSLCHLPPMIIHYLDWKDFGRENLSPGCPPFLASELAAVVPCRENAHSTHWFSRLMFTGLFQSDAQTLRHTPL